MSPRHSALGICLGASTVSMVLLAVPPDDPNGFRSPGLTPRIAGSWRIAHEGNPRQALLSALSRVEPASIGRIVCTGKKFRKLVNISAIAEPEAVEYAYPYFKPVGVNCPAIISAGGETFMAYLLNRSGQITDIRNGNRCASGTGEFFVQQLRRMGIALSETAHWTGASDPYPVSGRCSVFCKSDCTHATNKGIAKSRVAAGLCRMMADRVLSLLIKVPRQHIMLTGGTIHNSVMVADLHREIEGLIVPEGADCFEATGAALWGLAHDTKPYPGDSRLFTSRHAALSTLAPLNEFQDMVTFKSQTTDGIRPGDACILGLDVGSTTTKAVLLRQADDAMLATVYRRTNGDPVGAARKCYASIRDQVVQRTALSRISIVGLGVCGSGRQIAGLHAMTDGIINEIIAHATAAVYFDPQVDTLFEIGGQDAKYTFVVNGVPADYAMNEACSAGTGSFLEESAFEILGVRMTDIGAIALTGRHPINFNDQCAAFIASDVKNAIHEGAGHADIVAGLVYSICMNYTNRVKGNRPVGGRIFMQGGVCYNQAVPLAMAALVGKPIVVPPEPGLMGAFGVALEVKKRIAAGLLSPESFDLDALVNRSVGYAAPFTCKGGREKCDRRCEIAVVKLAGKKYPFGGACNRYYNLCHKISYEDESLDLIHSRQKWVFAEKSQADDQDPEAASRPVKRIALNRSFMVHTYYPFYSSFFKALGVSPLLPDEPSRKGIDQRGAAFCYPGELAHGFFHSILEMDPAPDYIFLPHFKSVPATNGSHGYGGGQLCPFVQGETYYLQTAFREQLDTLHRQGTRLIAPLLDLARGLAMAETPMLHVATALGVGRRRGRQAFQQGVLSQQRFMAALKQQGHDIISALAQNPDRQAVVVFGRAYNAFAPEAHMGIPKKFTSRGIPLIPFDALAFEQEHAKRHMYWGMGQQLLKAARFVKKHPQLFGVYVTNFSCGPDSFLIGYFREIMGRKPSLTLELDSHTADAGLETRVEAFLDIVTAYRRLGGGEKNTLETARGFTPARLHSNNGTHAVVCSSGEKVSLHDPRVTLLFPSMGRLSSEALAAAFRSDGLRAVAHPPADGNVLKLGRANTTCKECLPLILTTGTLLNYIQRHKRADEIVLYFMATASGPCRFGQYYVFMEDLIRRNRISDTAIFSLTSENGYAGLKGGYEQRGWWGLVIADVMEDIRAMLLAAATDTGAAMAAFEKIWRDILLCLETGSWAEVRQALATAARQLRRIALKRPVSDVPVIGLVGEIFVRRDGLSRQWLTEHLAQKGFATVCSPVAEWVHYCDYLVSNDLVDPPLPIMRKLKGRIRNHYKHRVETQIKFLLSASGLVHAESVRIPPVIKAAQNYLSPHLTGEAVLTVGGSLLEVAHRYCGIVLIGPFGCMPSRLSEAILTETMRSEDKLAAIAGNGRRHPLPVGVEDLPFLAIESDGSPFPQLIQTQLEAFCLRALRLHARMHPCVHGNYGEKRKITAWHPN